MIKTDEVIEAWRLSEKRVEDLKRLLNTAECDRSNARSALGKLLVPVDAKDGEHFHIWVNVDGKDRMLTVSLVHSDYLLNWRV
jgi:Ni,Fe-hydrogenase III large subunit